MNIFSNVNLPWSAVVLFYMVLHVGTYSVYVYTTVNE